MSVAWNAHFDLLARYNVWATDRLLAAVQPLSDDDYRRDMGLFFKSIHGTLNHLLVGEHRLWFVRFSEGTSPRVALDAEIETDRHRLAASLREGAARWALDRHTRQCRVRHAGLAHGRAFGSPRGSAAQAGCLTPRPASGGGGWRRGSSRCRRSHRSTAPASPAGVNRPACP